MKKDKKATIKDVAKAADVSPSTVSRVISGSSRISKETTRRVKNEMKNLGYHPNAIARSLGLWNCAQSLSSRNFTILEINSFNSDILESFKKYSFTNISIKKGHLTLIQHIDINLYP